MKKTLKKEQKKRKAKKEDREIKEMKKRGLEYIGTTDDFKMPEWMDCTWRRNACGKDECRICGKIKRDRQRHIVKGEDPDDLKFVFEDMSRDFKNAIRMIKKDAERRGIDISNLDELAEEEPPEPEEFPLSERVMSWRMFLYETFAAEELFEGMDMGSDAIKDLSWYANTLVAKTYRQLCNRWHIKKGDEYGKFDYEYTKYVLKECIKILKRSLSEIIVRKRKSRTSAEQFMFLYKQLLILEKSVLGI